MPLAITNETNICHHLFLYREPQPGIKCIIELNSSRLMFQWRVFTTVKWNILFPQGVCLALVVPSGSQSWTIITLGKRCLSGFGSALRVPKVNTHHPRGKTCGWNLWYPSLKQRMFYMHCTEASTRFLYKVNIFSSPKKCSLSILSGGTDILRWRTRTASMSFWLLSDCQDWGQGGVYYNRLHIEHVNPSPGGLQPEPNGRCSLKRCVQVLGGAEESEVCSIIITPEVKCCL